MPCFVEHALHVAAMLTGDIPSRHEIIKKVFAELSVMELEETPPEMARKIHRIIREVTGVHDPYLKIKDESTEFALKLLPYLREDIDKAKDRFEAIVRIVIAGNIIDFGADIHFKLESAHDSIKEAFTAPLDIENVRVLQKAMDRAENILYLADNCGEAVFDRFLIEPYREKITLAVRGFPILNDITLRELAHSGLDGLARVTDTGDAAPGVVLKYCKPEFVRAFNEADLIISKGQGNFETLSDTERPVVFLFRVKCKVLSAMLDKVPMGSLHVIPVNIPAF